MFKNLIYSIIILFLFSCQSIKYKKENNNDENTEIQSNLDKPSDYQTVNSQEQADTLNQKTDAEQQEIEVQDRIFFETNSSEITENAKKIIEVQIQWLISDKSIKITIEGHCDERGTREYNIALGEKRAYAMKNYLKKNGIDDSRIKVVSYGKERPAYIGDTEEIHSKNRRAVIVVN
jgi:peptidoglycan-associated lipoprotein